MNIDVLRTNQRIKRQRDKQIFIVYRAGVLWPQMVRFACSRCEFYHKTDAVAIRSPTFVVTAADRIRRKRYIGEDTCLCYPNSQLPTQDIIT